MCRCTAAAMARPELHALRAAVPSLCRVTARNMDNSSVSQRRLPNFWRAAETVGLPLAMSSRETPRNPRPS